MNKTEYLAFHKAACEKMQDITKRKNHDYAGGDSLSDPFLNFRSVSKMGICSVEQGFLTRMMDKFSRITTLTVQTGGENQVKDESIDDTLLDLANYSILLLGYLTEQRQGRKLPKASTIAVADTTEHWSSKVSI